MAEAFTSYEVDNDRSFRNALERAAEVTKDLRIPFGLISADFYKSQQSIFSLKGPGKYPPFKVNKDEKESKYAKRKKKKYGFDYPLLVASGSLASSLLGPSNNGSINLIGPLSMIIGTSIPYGIYHQSDEPRSKMPLRKFLFIGPESTQGTDKTQGRLYRWNIILQDHIDKEIKRQGF